VAEGLNELLPEERQKTRDECLVRFLQLPILDRYQHNYYTFLGVKGAHPASLPPDHPADPYAHGAPGLRALPPFPSPPIPAKAKAGAAPPSGGSSGGTKRKGKDGEEQAPQPSPPASASPPRKRHKADPVAPTGAEVTAERKGEELRAAALACLPFGKGLLERGLNPLLLQLRFLASSLSPALAAAGAKAALAYLSRAEDRAYIASRVEHLTPGAWVRTPQGRGKVQCVKPGAPAQRAVGTEAAGQLVEVALAYGRGSFAVLDVVPETWDEEAFEKVPPGEKEQLEACR